MTPIATPLHDTAALADRAAGCRAVVHAINPRYTDWDTQMMPLARQGMDLAQRLGASFMLPGNVYNYGAGMPALLDERTPERAQTRKGRLRCALEAGIRERARQGMRSVIIRAGDFFGVGTGAWFDLVIAKSIGQGKLVYPGPLDRAHAWAYLPDLARAFVAAAARDDLAPFTSLNFAGHTMTGEQLLDAIGRVAAAHGRAPSNGFRRGTMPWPLIRLGGLVVPMWRELAEMQYLWQVPHALDGSLMRRVLGPLPATALDEALAATLGFDALRAPEPGTAAAAALNPVR